MSSSQDSQAPVIVLLAEDAALVRMVAAEMLREEGRLVAWMSELVTAAG